MESITNTSERCSITKIMNNRDCWNVYRFSYYLLLCPALYVIYFVHYSGPLFFSVECWSLIDKLTLISNLTDWLVLVNKVCEPSTSSTNFNLSNSLTTTYLLYFFDMVKKKGKEKEYSYILHGKMNTHNRDFKGEVRKFL